MCPDPTGHMLLQNATASGLSVHVGHACFEWVVSIRQTWAGLFCSAVPQGERDGPMLSGVCRTMSLGRTTTA